MEFLDLSEPGRLLWLTLLPVLYLLSRPPRPRQDHATAYLGLWLRARDRLRRRPIRFRWLRFVLLVLAFVALVLAHSQPSLAGRQGARDLVVLLDASASMGAARPDGRAWDRAQERIAAAFARLPVGVDVRVGVFGEQVRVLRGDRQTLLAAIADLEPAGRGGVELDRLVQQVQEDGAAVWTLTDGLCGSALPGAGSLTVLDGTASNVGITAVDVLDDWPMPSLRVHATVHNHGEARRLRLVLEGGVSGALERDLELARGASEQLSLPLTRTTGGRVRISLRSPQGGPAWTDGLRIDDEVCVEVPAPPSPTIAVRVEPDSAPAVWAAARALAAEFGGTVVDAEQATAAFLITDGGRLTERPPGLRVLSFGTALAGQVARAPAPRLQDWSRTDPLTAGLDLSELTIERALVWPDVAALPPGSVPLLGGDPGILGVVVDRPESASVHLAFRLGDSNLFKLAAFPQLLRRAFARSFGAEARPQLVGEPLLDAAESDLAGALASGDLRAAAPDRDLPVFATPATRLALPLLVLALVLLAVRAYV